MSQRGLAAIQWLVEAGRTASIRGVCWLGSRMRRGRSPVSVTVVIADRRRRRLQRQLRGGVRQLQRTFGEQPLIVLVQERLDGGRRAGRHSVHRFPDGRLATVIRLALTLDQRRQTVDELLAALVDEYVALHDSTSNVAGLEALFADLGTARNGVPG